jgi:hypothetical protein
MPHPPESHLKAMRERGDGFRQFMRNGVWGTCCDCPRDSDGHAYPEFCENALRYDHQIPVEDLAGVYRAHSR